MGYEKRHPPSTVSSTATRYDPLETLVTWRAHVRLSMTAILGHASQVDDEGWESGVGESGVRSQESGSQDSGFSRGETEGCAT